MKPLKYSEVIALWQNVKIQVAKNLSNNTIPYSDTARRLAKFPTVANQKKSNKFQTNEKKITKYTP